MACDHLASTPIERLQRHIEGHYSDPCLSAASVARIHGISVRQVHRLFAMTGKTFGQHLLATRLTVCHQFLANPEFSRLSVTEIALAGGFNSIPTFYRAFAKHFELAPCSLRQVGTRAAVVNSRAAPPEAAAATTRGCDRFNGR